MVGVGVTVGIGVGVHEEGNEVGVATRTGVAVADEKNENLPIGTNWLACILLQYVAPNNKAKSKANQYPRRTLFRAVSLTNGKIVRRRSMRANITMRKVQSAAKAQAA